MKPFKRALLRTGMGKEKANIIWNMIGSCCYAFASMVLSFLVLRIIGKYEGGIFSFGFSTYGQQLFLLAYFGIRPFQITDAAGEYSFGEYLRHRLLTCAAAVIGGGLHLLACVYLSPALTFLPAYTPYKAAVIFLLVCYKVIDGFADAYESEFQRNGSLYLTGKSNTFRTILTVGVFLGSLLAGRNLLFSCLAAVGAQLLGVMLFDICVLRELDGIDRRRQKGYIKGLFGSTTLLFISVFLDFYIFSAAKYAIDAHMNDVYSGYFNIIFMPTSIINLAAGFVIRPFMTYLTEYWNQKRYGEFSGLIRKLAAVIGGLAVLAAGGAWLLGQPVLALFERLLGSHYSGILTAFQTPFVLIVLGGAFYAISNLFYYVLVILRKQQLIFILYALMTALAAALAPGFVIRDGIMGAATVYLLLMAVMAVLFAAGALLACMSEKNKKDR